MTLRLREGSWSYAIDEKGRIAIPSKIRKQAGKKWVWAFNGSKREVVLFPFRVWQRMMEKAKSPDQLRKRWHPFEDELDSQGRLNVPPEIKKLGEIGREASFISRGERLIVEKVSAREETVLREISEPFQSGEEANECLSKGDKVAYYSRPDRILVGKLTSGDGIVFTFNGEDENGIKVRVKKIPYCSFYPLRSK